jgi:hypothetical protein
MELKSLNPFNFKEKSNSNNKYINNNNNNTENISTNCVITESITFNVANNEHH